jgi:hypothetical protein
MYRHMASGDLDLDNVIARLRETKYPPAPTTRAICNIAIQLLTDLPNVVSVDTPITVCGDTHGQCFDLLELLRLEANVLTRIICFSEILLIEVILVSRPLYYFSA